MIGKITSIGNSIGVIIDKKVKKVLNLQKGDYIHYTIEDSTNIGKITNVGNSIGVIIDKKVTEFLKLEKGINIQLTIEKIEKKE